MMNDWTGNRNSIFTTLGASNCCSGERESMDYYATEPKAIDLLASKYDIPHKVWECACGGGSLSERLKELGHDVISTDLVERGYGIGGIDFLVSSIPDGVTCILTNPPYRYTAEFILHALDILPDDGVCILLLKTTALESRGRYEKIYRRHRPRYVFQFIDRLLCAKNGEFEYSEKHLGKGAQAYAWFVFEKSWVGVTTLDWI